MSFVFCHLSFVFFNIYFVWVLEVVSVIVICFYFVPINSFSLLRQFSIFHPYFSMCFEILLVWCHFCYLVCCSLFVNFYHCCCCCFVICQNSHILFGTLSFVSFTWILSSVVLSFVILSSVILSFVVLSFVVLSFCLLLFCHFDFYLVLEKCLNFLIRTLESVSDPALDVDNTGEVLALVHVSPGCSSLISRKTFAEKRFENENQVFRLSIIEFEKAHLLEGPWIL